jgi:hypothetical protein
MNPLLYMVLIFGSLACMGLAVFIPLVAKTLVVVSSIIFGEQAASIAKKQRSGTDLRDPNGADGFQ